VILDVGSHQGGFLTSLASAAARLNPHYNYHDLQRHCQHRDLHLHPPGYDEEFENDTADDSKEKCWAADSAQGSKDGAGGAAGGGGAGGAGCRLWPAQLSVHAFEPNPAAWTALERRFGPLRSSGHLRLVKAALSSAPAKAQPLFVPVREDGSVPEQSTLTPPSLQPLPVAEEAEGTVTESSSSEQHAMGRLLQGDLLPTGERFWAKNRSDLNADTFWSGEFDMSGRKRGGKVGDASNENCGDGAWGNDDAYVATAPGDAPGDRAAWGGDEATDVVFTPVLSVDCYVRSAGLEQVDIMKVDTEGFDALVVQGAAGLLQGALRAQSGGGSGNGRGSGDDDGGLPTLSSFVRRPAFVVFEYSKAWIFASDPSRHSLETVTASFAAYGYAVFLLGADR